MVLLEALARCVQLQEPALLVGETGVGKTAAVSYLSSLMGSKLVTLNLSQQSDSFDLLGGLACVCVCVRERQRDYHVCVDCYRFKPLPVSRLMVPLKEKLADLFTKTFDASKSTEFLLRLEVCSVFSLRAQSSCCWRGNAGCRRRLLPARIGSG